MSERQAGMAEIEGAYDGDKVGSSKPSKPVFPTVNSANTDTAVADGSKQQGVWIAQPVPDMGSPDSGSDSAGNRSGSGQQMPQAEALIPPDMDEEFAYRSVSSEVESLATYYQNMDDETRDQLMDDSSRQRISGFLDMVGWDWEQDGETTLLGGLRGLFAYVRGNWTPASQPMTNTVIDGWMPGLFSSSVNQADSTNTVESEVFYEGEDSPERFNAFWTVEDQMTQLESFLSESGNAYIFLGITPHGDGIEDRIAALDLVLTNPGSLGEYLASADLPIIEGLEGLTTEEKLDVRIWQVFYFDDTNCPDDQSQIPANSLCNRVHRGDVLNELLRLKEEGFRAPDDSLHREETLFEVFGFDNYDDPDSAARAYFMTQMAEYEAIVNQRDEIVIPDEWHQLSTLELANTYYGMYNAGDNAAQLNNLLNQGAVSPEETAALFNLDVQLDRHHKPLPPGQQGNSPGQQSGIQYDMVLFEKGHIPPPDYTLLVTAASILFDPVDWAVGGVEMLNHLEAGNYGQAALTAGLMILPAVSSKADDAVDFVRTSWRASDNLRPALSHVLDTASDRVRKLIEDVNAIPDQLGQELFGAGDNLVYAGYGRLDNGVHQGSNLGDNILRMSSQNLPESYSSRALQRADNFGLPVESYSDEVWQLSDELGIPPDEALSLQDVRGRYNLSGEGDIIGESEVRNFLGDTQGKPAPEGMIRTDSGFVVYETKNQWGSSVDAGGAMNKFENVAQLADNAEDIFITRFELHVPEGISLDEIRFQDANHHVIEGQLFHLDIPVTISVRNEELPVYVVPLKFTRQS